MRRRAIKGLRWLVREIIFGVKIVNGRSCGGNVGWGRGLELGMAGTCEVNVDGEIFSRRVGNLRMLGVFAGAWMPRGE